MGDEKRMADEYEVIQAIHVGDREVVFGVDEGGKKQEKYMCAYYQSNVLFGEYSGCMVSGDYLEIMKLFAVRVSEQCDRAKEEIEKVTVPVEVITPEQCIPDDWEKSIDGKVVAISAEILRPKHRSANNQLWLCGGGSACYAINLYSGKSNRFERRDVLGEIKVLPDWAGHYMKNRLEALRDLCMRTVQEVDLLLPARGAVHVEKPAKNKELER